MSKVSQIKGMAGQKKVIIVASVNEPHIWMLLLEFLDIIIIII